MEEAVAALTNLELEPGSRQVSIKCNISESRALSLLNQFMVARLIHCPEDRTRDCPAQNVPLQPTAKGVYVLSQHLMTAPNSGSHSRHVTHLLESAHNTMECISLVRDSNDVVQTSKYLTLLLFQKLAGKHPNLYKANDVGDLPNGKSSPYHHRYFTHPDSDALTQYYVSSVGVRLLENHVDGHVMYYFSGKAAWQWVMECCEVVSGIEIIDILQEFLNAGFIEHYDESAAPDEDINPPREFICSKAAKYSFTLLGMSVAGWTSNLPTTPQSSGFPKFVKSRVFQGVELTKEDLIELQAIEKETNTTFDMVTGKPVELKHDDDFEASRELREQRLLGFKHENPSLSVILQDPGLTLLFKSYLEDTHCVENHIVYVSVNEVIRVFSSFSRKVSNETLASLLTLIYSTYDSYLSPQAPKEFNMISTWRDELCLLTSRLRGAKTVPESLVLVSEIVRVFELIKNHAFRMMEIDSFPRFLECRDYRRCLRTFRWLESDKYW